MTKEEFIQQINESGIVMMNMPEKVALIENGEISVNDIFQIVIANQLPESYLASWILNHYVDNHPDAIKDNLDKLIAILPQIKRTGFVRLALRLIMITATWETENLGLLFDFCLRQIESTTVPTGVKTNAMAIIDRIAENEPGIREEVVLVVEEQLPYLSTGGINRAKKLLKKYKKNL